VDTYLYRAFQKYGIDAFIAEVLEIVADTSILNDRERYWICQLGTEAPAGYNMTSGGDGGDVSSSPKFKQAMVNRDYAGVNNPNYGKRGPLSPNYGKTRTVEQRDNLVGGLTAAWATNIDRRNKLSAKMTGEGNPRFGKKPHTATKVDFNGVMYDSLADASRATGRSSQFIKKNGTIINDHQTQALDGAL
jgi:group I intron endonuclease